MNEIFKILTTSWGRVAGLLNHVDAIGYILSALRGGVIDNEQVPEKIRHLVKGMKGFLGLGDERTLSMLLEELEHTKGFRGGREIVLGFFEWHFTESTVDEWLVSIWFKNYLRIFLTKWIEDKAVKIGTEKSEINSSTSDPSGGTVTTKTVIEKEVFSEFLGNPALDFLKMMVTVIKSEKVREDGYAKLLAQFRAAGYPNVPEGAAELVRKFREGTMRVGGAVLTSPTLIPPAIAQARVDAEAELQRRRAAPKSWLGRLIRSR